VNKKIRFEPAELFYENNRKNSKILFEQQKAAILNFRTFPCLYYIQGANIFGPILPNLPICPDFSGKKLSAILGPPVVNFLSFYDIKIHKIDRCQQ
jgi:hypothetical protein